MENQQSQIGRGINVNKIERVAALISGAALLGMCFKKRSAAGVAAGIAGAAMIYRGATGHCELYHQLGLSTAGPNENEPYKQAIKVEKAITIGVPVEDVYSFWRNFENLSQFMTHLESVTVLDGTKSHWVAKAPMGKTVSWDAEIINEIRNELIAWQSLEGSDVYNSGSVHFNSAPGDRGTEVSVVIRYTPPGGMIGAAIAKLWGEEPAMQIEDDLHRLKQLMETGEIATVNGQPTGKGVKKQRGDQGIISAASHDAA